MEIYEVVVRKHVIFTGRVQGVNFRKTSMKEATKLGLTGWVRNLEDGTVEMEVQGPEEVIEELYEFLMTNIRFEIDQLDETTIDIVDDETEFIIQY